METNILKALINIANLKTFEVSSYYGGNNRINDVGTTLEYFIKDAFCGSFNKSSLEEKAKEYGKALSYIGNAKNPPDFMIKNGDALEVKKLIKYDSLLALNSSYPKDKLYSDSPLITQACRESEKWEVKDIIYAVGAIPKSTIQSLWFVYGDCYAADREVYERVKSKISEGVKVIEGVEFSDTNELGRVNKVDPLGITYLRVRGMWGIENPAVVFEQFDVKPDANKTLITALMKEKKYAAFPEADRKELEAIAGIRIEAVEVRDPNNLAKSIKSKLIQMKI